MKPSPAPSSICPASNDQQHHPPLLLPRNSGRTSEETLEDRPLGGLRPVLVSERYRLTCCPPLPPNCLAMLVGKSCNRSVTSPDRSSESDARRTPLYVSCPNSMARGGMIFFSLRVACRLGRSLIRHAGNYSHAVGDRSSGPSAYRFLGTAQARVSGRPAPPNLSPHFAIQFEGGNSCSAN